MKGEDEALSSLIKEAQQAQHSKPVKDLQIINEELAEYINSPSWNRPAFYDDDDDEYSIQVSEKSPIAIALEESDNSLNMENEDLDTIPETKLDEVIKYSVEDLVPIPSEFEGILDNMCDVPFSDKNHFDAESDLIEYLLTRDTSIFYSPKIDSLLEEFAGELAHIDPIPLGIVETDYDLKDDIFFIEQLLYDDTSSEDDSFKDIEYVEASPPDFELFSLEEVKDEILRAKLLNIHLFITMIKSLNNNPTLDCVLNSPSSSFLSYTDNSSPEFETFSDHTEERSSGSTTTHANNSLFEYDSFHFEIEPDQDELSRVAMEAILGEPRVYVPNILPTHITLLQDLDFSSSNDSLGSDLEVSFPSRTRNKIFDPGIFLEVQSKRFLSLDTFSPTYVSLLFDDHHILSFTYVIRTSLPYFTYPVESPFLLSFGSEDIIFDPGISVFYFSSLEPVVTDMSKVDKIKAKRTKPGTRMKRVQEIETKERAEVYYECKEPFKSLKYLWVRSKSIAATWLEKVVTPLIEPTI
uniref:Reverse transcriptase domain-containing protein n=1 Tax=Tanacetum cinerariifolium TaxID=118510 RepID=A0A6L2J6T8_TANCI|nr:hypothetical protein [Tanacetum cinerariifolium]